MPYSPVWLTTTEQLDRILASWSSTGPVRRRLGFVQVETGTPYGRMFFGLGPPVPLVLLATGILDPGPEQMHFESRPSRGRFLRMHGLLEICFDLRWSEIENMSQYDAESPVAPEFDLTFIHFRTSRKGLLGDFLASHAPAGRHAHRMNEATVQLHRELDSLLRRTRSG